MAWLPLSKRHDAEAAKEYDALHEGVPEWLAAPVAQWVFDVFSSMQYDDDFSHKLDVIHGMLRRPMPKTGKRVRDSITELGNAARTGTLMCSTRWCGRPNSLEKGGNSGSASTCFF